MEAVFGFLGPNGSGKSTTIWHIASQDQVLAKEIYDLIEAGETKIDLTALTDFTWDHIGVFGPYTTDDLIEEAMKIKFKGDNGGIDLLEDRFLLVFADEKKAIKTVVLSREYGDYTSKDNKLLIVE